MRRITLALLVAMTSPLLMGAGDSVFPSLRHVDLSAADRDALDGISAYMNGITTMKGSFIQIEPSGNVDEGRFYISKPGRMRFEYAAPVPTLLVSDGSTVAVANTRLNTVDRYPIFETPLDVILSKTIDIRHSPELVSVEHREGAFVVNLRANQAHTRANISLVFSAPEYELRQWTVIDNQGLSTTVALRDVVAGGDLPASLFVLPDKNTLAHRREN
ncbi:MAG TPA: outer membrane lipoprotein carrier protein LolA [Rhizomicrobium sp.]|nr:outer membrane lipoprotein carrier protein LolA [Rhizomicrobium sp.]